MPHDAATRPLHELTGNPRPLRVTRRNDDLGCDVRRVVGYVGTCPVCGEAVPTCSTVHLARLALQMHALREHAA